MVCISVAIVCLAAGATESMKADGSLPHPSQDSVGDVRFIWVHLSAAGQKAGHFARAKIKKDFATCGSREVPFAISDS